MSASSLFGVPPGRRLSVRMPEKLLQGLVIALISVAAILMLVRMGH